MKRLNRIYDILSTKTPAQIKAPGTQPQRYPNSMYRICMTSGMPSRPSASFGPKTCHEFRPPSAPSPLPAFTTLRGLGELCSQIGIHITTSIPWDRRDPDGRPPVGGHGRFGRFEVSLPHARARRRLDGKRGTERGGRTVQRFNWWHRIASSSCWLLRSGRSDMHSVGGRHLSPQAPLSTGTSMPRWPTFLQIACGLRPGGCSYPIDSYTRTPKGWLMDTP